MEYMLIIAMFALIACVYVLAIQNLLDEHLRNFDELLAKHRQEICKIIEGSDSNEENS